MQPASEGSPARHPSLRKNFAWTLAGNLIFTSAQWAIVIAITKLSTLAAVGEWTLGLALTAPIFILCQLKLRSVQTTDARGENRWGEFLALRLLGLSVALLAVGVVVAIFYRDRTGLVISMIAIAKTFDGGSDLIYGQEQRREQMRAVALSQAARGVVSLVASIAVLWMTSSIAATAMATAASYGLCLLWDIVRMRSLLSGQSLRPRWQRAPLLRLFRLVLPLGIVTAIGSLQVNVPRYFLEQYASREELGVFGSLAYLLIAGNMVIGALANAALPRLARHAAADDWGDFRRLLWKMLRLGFLLGLAGVVASYLFGAMALEIIYSAEVARHADVLTWLSIASGLLWSYIFLGTTLDATRKFRVQPWIHGASTLVIAGSAMMLVPSHGMLGAAWSILAGYVVECIAYVAIVGRGLPRAGA